MCILSFQYILTNCSPEFASFHSHQQGMKVSVSSQYHQHSISKIQLFVNLKGEGIPVLICVYLVVNDDEYLNICLRARYFVFPEQSIYIYSYLSHLFSPLLEQSSRLLTSKFTSLFYVASYKNFNSDIEALKWI